MLHLLANGGLAEQPRLPVIPRLDLLGHLVVGAHGVAKHDERPRNVADLVTPVSFLNVDPRVAVGKVRHLPGDAADRRGEGPVHGRNGDAGDESRGK